MSNPIKCPECFSVNIVQDQDEPELWDCLDCCIWFDLDHPNNRGAHEHEPTDQGS